MRGKFLLLLNVLALVSQAQINPVEQAIEYIVEFGQTESETPDLIQIAEQLSYLQQNPISLNTATAEDLQEIPLLNTFLVFNFLEYRKRTGRILSYFQLADIKGYSIQLIKLLQPFTTLSYTTEPLKFPRHFNHQLAIRYRQLFEENTAFNNDNFPGHSSENYVRYRLQGDGRLFAGLTLQRDPGEVWLPNGYTPDFTSIHFEYRLRGIIKRILLGDFAAEFGQGLTLWSSLAFTKSADALNVARFGRGLRHYTGTDENRFLRGAGVVLDLGNVDVSVYHSANRNDANLVAQEDGVMVATSLQTSGFHRTDGERQDKRSMPIRLTGIYAHWRPERLRLGLHVLHTKFGFPLVPAPRIENALRFSGNQQLHTALDWKYLYHRIFVFGEVSFDWLSKRTAATTGLQIQAADGLQWALHYRYLAPGWFALYAAPFSETGRDGEQGVYLGINWQLPNGINLAFFADHYAYLWLRTNVNRPTAGSDYMLQLNYAPRRANMYLRLRAQNRPRTRSGEETVRSVIDEQRLSIRYHITLPINRELVLQARAEWVDFSQGETHQNGLLTFAGISWRINEKWQLKARYSLFDTDGYNAAIWAFEDDVPYGFSVPAFYDRGAKWYVLAGWQALSNVEFWIRIEDAYSTDWRRLPDELPKRRTGIRALLRFSF